MGGPNPLLPLPKPEREMTYTPTNHLCADGKGVSAMDVMRESFPLAGDDTAMEDEGTKKGAPLSEFVTEEEIAAAGSTINALLRKIKLILVELRLVARPLAVDNLAFEEAQAIDMTWFAHQMRDCGGFGLSDFETAIAVSINDSQ